MESKQRDPNWINVRIDWLVIKMGLRRAPKLEREPEVFKKTATEKEALKKAKAEASGLGKSVGVFMKQPTHVELLNPKKLIVNLKNSSKSETAKTTHCFRVSNESEAKDIINSGSFFLKAEIKSAYYDSKPFNY